MFQSSIILIILISLSYPKTTISVDKPPEAKQQPMKAPERSHQPQAGQPQPPQFPAGVPPQAMPFPSNSPNPYPFRHFRSFAFRVLIRPRGPNQEDCYYEPVPPRSLIGVIYEV